MIHCNDCLVVLLSSCGIVDLWICLSRPKKVYAVGHPYGTVLELNPDINLQLLFEPKIGLRDLYDFHNFFCFVLKKVPIETGTFGSNLESQLIE